MEASLLMQCIITEKRSHQINTLWWNKEKAHGSQIVKPKENLKLSYGGPSQQQASAPNNGLKLYAMAVIESEAWPTVVKY